MGILLQSKNLFAQPQQPHQGTETAIGNIEGGSIDASASTSHRKF